MRKAYRRRLQALTGAVQAVSGQREGVADSDTLQDFITVIAKSKDTKSCLYVTDQTGSLPGKISCTGCGWMYPCSVPSDLPEPGSLRA